MLRWQTAGGAHGEALVAMIEGCRPACVLARAISFPHWHAVDLDMVAVPA